MVFNSKKFEVIEYGTNERLKQNKYIVESNKIETKITVKDLRVRDE